MKHQNHKDVKFNTFDTSHKRVVLANIATKPAAKY